MYRRIIYGIVLLLAVTGCRPRGILSSSEMRDVVYDLHRAEAILQVAGYNVGHDEELAKYYYVVLQKHGITQAQFDSSLVWYTDHPQRFNKIYPPVLDRCNEEYEQWRLTVEGIKPLQERNLRPWEEVQHEMIYGFSHFDVPKTQNQPVQVPFVNSEIQKNAK